MASDHGSESTHLAWSAVSGTALRVAFGIIWAIDAALTWSPEFATNYVGYLHNAARGQAGWSAWWFDMWIALVTPHAGLFLWLTRIAETALAVALLLGFARKSIYVLGALFSLLIWSTAEGFGGPYTVGAANMGTALSYVLIFIALIIINNRSGVSPYSLDYLIEGRWPSWRRVAEWSRDTRPRTATTLPWRLQTTALVGIALLVFFLIGGLHSSLNVTAPTPTAAAAAVSPLTLAAKRPLETPFDARLPPLQPGPTAEVHVEALDRAVTIASGVQYQAWTFGGTVPAPVIHVRQGQTVNVTFTNRGTMEHSLDFHSAITPPSLHYVDIKPGEKITYSFVAKVPGAFVYHCGTAPVLLHMANGMYGAIIVDPIEPLPPADESYVLVQSEWYTQQISGSLMGPNFEKMAKIQPDEVVFNGIAFQYRDHPLKATAGKRVRLYFVNAGPSLWSSFHVIGGIFGKVYTDDNAAHAQTGVSTQTIGPGAGAIFDITLPEPGHYTFVDHAFAHSALGAVGVLDVRAPGGGGATAKPPVEQAEPVAGSAVPKPTASGPYAFNAERGASLYAANCAACHQASGTGLPSAFPPLVKDPVVQAADPAEHIDTVLHGAHGRTINGTTYAAPMPGFAATLSDSDIADIINHERSSWGNNGKLITAGQVEAARAASK